MSNYILETQQICKFFSQNQVLHDISFQLKSGEIMALMGENGAGKSTLIKIITGCYSRDSGKVLLDGREIHPKNTFESQLLGIQSVYQELNLSPFLSVAENLYLGHEIRGRNHLIDWRSTYAAAEKILSDMGMHMDVHVPLNRLTAAQQQMVAIARAVLAKAKVLILDEATSSLDADEVQVLFREIRKLKNAGMGIIYITHRMNEVFEISDRITILRNGHLFGVYFAS